MRSNKGMWFVSVKKIWSRFKPMKWLKFTREQKINQSIFFTYTLPTYAFVRVISSKAAWLHNFKIKNKYYLLSYWPWSYEEMH